MRCSRSPFGDDSLGLLAIGCSSGQAMISGNFNHTNCSFWDKLLSRRSSSLTTVFFSLFGICASATLLVWVLRGLRVLTGMAGGVIWLLLILSLTMLVMALLPKHN